MNRTEAFNVSCLNNFSFNFERETICISTIILVDELNVI